MRTRTSSLSVLTIGHSTRTIEEFIRLLEAHEVRRVIDVRTMPRSRHNPQFNSETLPKSLKKAGIGYESMWGLGGLRRPLRDSKNMGWRNPSFRGYADYMQTPEFKESLRELIAVARKERVAIMCAEAVPWRCHRSLIADALAARGITAEHIMSGTRRTVHSLTPFARVRGTSVVYPAVEPPDGSGNTRQKGTKGMKGNKRPSARAPGISSGQQTSMAARAA